MPFAVFRRHQRKLLAIFAILAMFGFVVADSLPRMLNGSPVSSGNSVVVNLYDKPIRQSDLAVVRSERNDANLFMSELTSLLYRGQGVRDLFGDLSTKSLVDALVLEHEADRLSMPGGPDVAREFLKKNVGAGMTKELFELVLSRFNNRVSGEQLLTEIGNQIRLANVRRLIGPPVVTPYDVFSTYKDQNERVSARAVGYRVEDYLAKVKEPSTSDVQAYYDKYKDVLPDPARPTPGFKVPRQIEVEILSIDGTALANSLKDKLTEDELRTYYENRKNEFKVRSPFPDDIFAGAPELTPPIVESFSDKRPYLANSLADEKAQAEIIDRFERVKGTSMIPFMDNYLQLVDEAEEAKKTGAASIPTIPKPEPLKTLAAKESLEYEITPLIPREVAEKYGLISGAEVGTTRLSGGHKFAEEIFESKGTLYEPIELTDFTNRRFLVRKLQDVPPRIPPLDEIRPEVALAWKTAQARPEAEKAAKAYADKLKAAGGKLDAEIVDGHPVITTDPVSKFQTSFPFPGQNFEAPATVSEISQVPNAGEAFRKAYFDLHEGDVVVVSNQPETIYYVLALKQRFAASFSVLYAPNGDYPRYRSETLADAMRKRNDQWMNVLRAQAGIKPDWTPPDESKNANADDAH